MNYPRMQFGDEPRMPQRGSFPVHPDPVAIEKGFRLRHWLLPKTVDRVNGNFLAKADAGYITISGNNLRPLWSLKEGAFPAKVAL